MVGMLDQEVEIKRVNNGCYVCVQLIKFIYIYMFCLELSFIKSTFSCYLKL